MKYFTLKYLKISRKYWNISRPLLWKTPKNSWNFTSLCTMLVIMYWKRSLCTAIMTVFIATNNNNNNNDNIYGAVIVAQSHYESIRVMWWIWHGSKRPPILRPALQLSKNKNGDGGCSFWQPTYRLTTPGRWAWSEGRRLLGAVPYSSNELGELSQWLWATMTEP